MTMIHDADGNITQMTDAEGNSFAFDYNRFYQLLQSTSAE